MADVLQLSLFHLLEESATPVEPEPQLRNDVPALTDADERANALDTTRSFLIEAPAGSGKTGLLIQRFLKLLAGEDITAPEQLLAITFTRKATAEMRERLLGQLVGAAEGKAPENAFDRSTRPLAQAALERSARLGWALIEQPHRLNIQTIDGVCAQIVRTLPVLSGAFGSMSPADDAGPLYAEAARRTLMQLGGTNVELHQSLEDLLLHRDGSLFDLEGHIAQMLRTRDQWMGLLSRTGGDLQVDLRMLDDEVKPRLEQTLAQAICRQLTAVRALLPAWLLEELADLAATLANGAEDGAELGLLRPCRDLRTAPGLAAEDLAHWRALRHLVLTKGGRSWRKSAGAFRPKPDARAKTRLEDALRACQAIPGLDEAFDQLNYLPPARYPEDQWQIARALLVVLARALTELDAVFAANGQCDFLEPALLARAALRKDQTGADMSTATGMRLRHLLVDEMQDTSASQYELIELLTRSWGAAGETVFLVGDPKQSIYMFRQACVERFLHTLRCGRLGHSALRLEVLRLNANFRSQAALVADFNDDFLRIFPAAQAAANPEDVTYLRAEPVRTPSEFAATTGSRIWHIRTLDFEKDRTQKRLRETAAHVSDGEEIRSAVEWWRNRPLPRDRTRPWRIAVLVRRREDLTATIAALKNAAIPYRAVEIDGLDERQEILDLVALTRALLHPADRTAWLALLRSPWCGLTLADLHTLAGGDDPGLSEQTVVDAIRTRGEALPSDGRSRLNAFWRVFAPFVLNRGQHSLSQLVQGAWRAFGTSAYSNEEQRENAEQYFRLLDAVEQTSTAPLSLRTILDRLNKLYAAPSLEPNAVELLTIHKAKGLEWDVVLVPALDRPPPPIKGRLLDYLDLDFGDGSTGDAAAVMFAPIRSKGGEGQELNRWMLHIEKQRQAAERKRLFYVACTRAREQLHLFATLSRSAKGAVQPTAASLLQAAWPAAEEQFNAATTKQTAEVIPMPASYPGVLERLAADASAPSQERHLERIPTSAFTLENAEPPAPTSSSPRFTRPEGSFARRIFGNTVHAYLEQLTLRIAGGAAPAALLAELPQWDPRIRVLVKSAGAAAYQTNEIATEILRALANTLQSVDGRWILQAHAGAANEAPFVAADEHGKPAEMRLDRCFLAGASPGQIGSDHLWIIDYKTSSHGARGLEGWLSEQKSLHAPQLERYALVVGGADKDTPIRLGLYYPMLSRLLWWPRGGAEG